MARHMDVYHQGRLVNSSSGEPLRFHLGFDTLPGGAIHMLPARI